MVRRLKPYQRINHFPNSQELGKKNLLSDNLKKMKVVFPKEYNFFPETWNLP
jgi:tubulin polyglutamylase TTLL6/13